MNREAIFGALYAKLQLVALVSSGPFVTVTRRLEMLDKVDQSAMPWVGQMQTKQNSTYKVNAGRVVDLRAEWWVYSYQADETQSPAASLNPLLDACEAVLAPSPGFQTQTLGGLVSFCAVDGEIEIYEGLLGSKAAAVLPIRIQVATP